MPPLSSVVGHEESRLRAKVQELRQSIRQKKRELRETAAALADVQRRQCQQLGIGFTLTEDVKRR